jgi:hypothetical protein
VTDAPAGWYPDPSGSGFQRYWNGREWTSDTQPAPGTSQFGYAGPQRTHQREVLVGWITAVFFPPIGAFIGWRLLKTEERGQARWMIALAAIVFVLAVVGIATDDSGASWTSGPPGR